MRSRYVVTVLTPLPKFTLFQCDQLAATHQILTQLPPDAAVWIHATQVFPGKS